MNKAAAAAFFFFSSFSAFAGDASYSYSPVDNGAARRDPFATYTQESLVITDDLFCNRSPLACVSLDEVKLQAIVSGTATPRAMLQTKEGKSYVVRTGDLLAGGIIKAIRADGVLVERTYRDGIGAARKNNAILTLR